MIGQPFDSSTRERDWRYTEKRHDWQWPLGTRVIVSELWMSDSKPANATVIAYSEASANGGFAPHWYFLDIDGHPTTEDGYYLVSDQWLTVIEGEK